MSSSLPSSLPLSQFHSHSNIPSSLTFSSLTSHSSSTLSPSPSSFTEWKQFEDEYTSIITSIKQQITTLQTVPPNNMNKSVALQKQYDLLLQCECEGEHIRSLLHSMETILLSYPYHMKSKCTSLLHDYQYETERIMLQLKKYHNIHSQDILLYQQSNLEEVQPNEQYALWKNQRE